jgi:hypothetical protein
MRLASSDFVEEADGRLAGAPLPRDLLPLLKTMLEVIQRCQEAVLQEEEETEAVIRAAVQSVFGDSAAADWAASEYFSRGLDGLLQRVLKRPDEAFATGAMLVGNGAAPAHARLAPCCGELRADPEVVANWFCALALRMRDVHPQAAEMLRMRFCGLGSREIAERLQMPVRLVGHVLGALVETEEKTGAAGAAP